MEVLHWHPAGGANTRELLITAPCHPTPATVPANQHSATAAHGRIKSVAASGQMTRGVKDQFTQIQVWQGYVRVLVGKSRHLAAMLATPPGSYFWENKIRLVSK